MKEDKNTIEKDRNETCKTVDRKRQKYEIGKIEIRQNETEMRQISETESIGSK